VINEVRAFHAGLILSLLLRNLDKTACRPNSERAERSALSASSLAYLPWSRDNGSTFLILSAIKMPASART
jgi:hypothetical protein